MSDSGTPPAQPSWTPTPFDTAWDDLLAGVASREDWTARRAQIRARFLDLLRDGEKPAMPKDLQVEVERVWEAGGYQIRRIGYNVEADERAHAYLAVPAGPVPAGGFPAVLCLHGTTNWGARQTLGLPPESGDPHGERTVEGKDFARLLVRAGYVTLSPEHFCSATRCPAEGPYDTAAFYRRHPRWTAVGKSTFENHVALNVLRALPEVNGARIGVTGHSLGGHNTVFIAAYDERVSCIVPSCAGSTFRQNPKVLAWSRDHWYIYFPQLRERLLRGERLECDFHEMMALVAPRPHLEFLAFNDGDALTQAHRALLHLKLHELYRLLGREEAHAFIAFGDGHAMPDLTRTALASWFDRWLKHDGDPLGSWRGERY